MSESKLKKQPENIILKRMYVGPVIKKYGLTTGTVYEDINVGNIKTAIEKYPEIKELFVEIDKDFAKNKGNINILGTRENIFYKKLLKKLGGK